MPHSKNSSNSVIYSIPCSGCLKSYIGETGRGLDIRIKEHKRDVRLHKTTNAMVLHIEECNHLPKWDDARILTKPKDRTLRRNLEAAFISVYPSVNTRSGFVSWSKTAAK